MNSFIFVALFVLLAAANASVLPVPIVSAYSAGPVLSAYSAGPLVSAYAAPWAGAGLVGQQTVVAGPSGTIATGRTLAAPAISSYSAPLLARTIW